MKKIISTIVLLTPSLVFAQTLQPITDANSLTKKLLGLGNIATYLLVALAVIFIIWNVVMYMIRGSDEGARAEAAKSIGYGLLGLFIIVSLWGLVSILTRTFAVTSSSHQLPTIDNMMTGGSNNDGGGGSYFNSSYGSGGERTYSGTLNF